MCLVCLPYLPLLILLPLRATGASLSPYGGSLWIGLTLRGGSECLEEACPYVREPTWGQKEDEV